MLNFTTINDLTSEEKHMPYKRPHFIYPNLESAEREPVFGGDEPLSEQASIKKGFNCAAGT